MTAVSAIVFFLGLLFGFQRPSRLLVAAATSCYRPASLHPFQPRGGILYFESAFLSSDRCRFRFTASARPASSRGAEPTSFPPSLSTGFVDPSLPPVRLSSFGAGRRLLPPPRWVSTPLVDFVFRLSLLLGWRLRRQCDFAFPSEGARLLPPPRSESTTFVDPLLPAASAPPLSRHPPVEGLRLLPSPRLESTDFLVRFFSLRSRWLDKPPTQVSTGIRLNPKAGTFHPTLELVRLPVRITPSRSWSGRAATLGLPPHTRPTEQALERSVG